MKGPAGGGATLVVRGIFLPSLINAEVSGKTSNEGEREIVMVYRCLGKEGPENIVTVVIARLGVYPPFTNTRSSPK